MHIKCDFNVLSGCFTEFVTVLFTMVLTITNMTPRVHSFIPDVRMHQMSAYTSNINCQRRAPGDAVPL